MATRKKATKPAVETSAPRSQQEPTARNCPLVLDGEMAAAAFTPDACLKCDEFDCRFCETPESAGMLQSRVFADGDADGDDEDGWGADSFGDDLSSGGESDEDDDLF